MADISKLSPASGRLIGEDGKTKNIVDILGGTPIGTKTIDISKLASRSGRVIGEDGKIYNIVDIINDFVDRINEEITDLSKLKNWLGETTTPLAKDSTVNPIIISGISVTASEGDVAAYDNGTTVNQFIFSEAGTWQPYNDKLDVYTKDESDERYEQKTNLKALAYKNSASGSYTPAGTVSITPTTENVVGSISAGTLPSISYDSATETLTFNQGAYPTGTNKSVVTGATAAFSGHAATITVE